MNHSLLKHYAQAYFSLGREKNKVEVYQKDLTFLSGVFSKDPEFIKFLSSPMILSEEKDKVLDENIKGNVDIATYGFLQVLIKKKVISYFQEIKKDFDHLYHEDKGILEGRIYTPFSLSDETMEKLTKVFSEKYHRQVVFRLLIDKNVIGGMRIYINDTLYDYSIDNKLNQFRKKLIVQD